MRFTTMILRAILAAGAVALSAGCAGGGAQSPASSLPASSAAQRLDQATPHSASWMLPQSKGKKSILIYAAAGDTTNVNVYDYASGEQVGMLSGVIADAGCVDGTGNVYIVSPAGSVSEYAHGGTQPINSYTPGGDLVGCSVDKRGDLAITGSSPGSVTVYAKGDPQDDSTYSNAKCETQAAMGYDDKGNIIGVGQDDNNTISICAVLAGARAETTLSSSGITINFPNGTMWDGQYIGVGDQEAGSGKSLTGMNETVLSGSTLTSDGEVILDDDCYRGYVDVRNPFVVGRKNTPLNKRQGSVVVGSNLLCSGTSGQGIELWHYPAGGSPFKRFATAQPVTVIAVSIGT